MAHVPREILLVQHAEPGRLVILAVLTFSMLSHLTAVLFDDE